MRVAAIQLEVELGDVRANLATCEALARQAARDGAQAVALPEFFTTGAAFLPELADAGLAPDGAAAQMLERVAREEGVLIGGSFLCRDGDGEVRNAYLLAGPGGILGRHDKDIPTMWENALYVGGNDDGIIETGDLTVGAAVCWEFMRSQTARRLRGKVDIVLGGSNWWSIPEWHPRAYTRRAEAANAKTAALASAVFGRYIGAPVAHGAICGPFSCPIPELPLAQFRGHFQGGAQIADATGKVLARYERTQGSGYAIADVDVMRSAPLEPVPAGYWLHSRGAFAASFEGSNPSPSVEDAGPLSEYEAGATGRISLEVASLGPAEGVAGHSVTYPARGTAAPHLHSATRTYEEVLRQLLRVGT